MPLRNRYGWSEGDSHSEGAYTHPLRQIPVVVGSWRSDAQFWISHCYVTAKTVAQGGLALRQVVKKSGRIGATEVKWLGQYTLGLEHRLGKGPPFRQHRP